MKLAAIYNVWDGDELLEGSIKQIREHVDEIVVVYQTTSNHGEHYSPKIPFRHISTWQYFTPCLHDSPMKNEIAKRQIGIRCAQAMDCTHFILMDCDEYYDSDQFAAAKQRVEVLNLTATVVKLKTYYKLPTYQVDGFDTYFVPFICKIYPGIKCGNFREFSDKYYCDPTRQVNTGDVSQLHPQECFMHHYSWIRKNIERKLNNSSAKINFKDKIPALLEEYNKATIGSEISWYEGRKLVEVENLFNIDIEKEKGSI
jgi:hypothetical protein